MAILDRIDFEILSLLQKNARLTNKELAAAIGLAPSSCHERLKRLRAESVLLGAHAEVDPSALGIGLEALLMIELPSTSATRWTAYSRPWWRYPRCVRPT